MNTKAILASTLLTALMAASSVHAQGKAGNVYEEQQAVQSTEIVKVSLKQSSTDYGVNR